MSAAAAGRAADLVARLAGSSGLDVEAFEKRGRSRRIERGAEGEAAATAVEAGWAVRAGDPRRSFFATGTGELPLDAEWPEPSAHPLRLPDRQPLPAWTPPRALAAPLAGESEARALLDAIERELGRELPAARLAAARYEEGTSESVLASSRGVEARLAARAVTVRLEAAAGERRVVAEASVTEASELKPLGLARRLADRLLALAGNARAGGDLLLIAAPLAARLVEALAPLLCGREAAAALATIAGARGELGGETIRMIDDGALAGGLLSAPADGEGMPCREVALIESGRFVRPLVAWWEAERPEAASGCMRRASYRDLPRRAPTHLYLAADLRVAVADLLAEPGCGAYLLDAEGAVRLDAATGRFAVPVSGFALDAGRAAGGLGRRLLVGDLRSWLGGVRGLARDLTFVAGDGMFGAPTLLASGLALAPDRAG